MIATILDEKKLKYQKLAPSNKAVRQLGKHAMTIQAKSFGNNNTQKTCHEP